MALSDSKAYDIYEELKYKFLFNSDINCIHILLNLYDLENNINNIFPKYVSIHHLRRNISRLLRDRRGNHLIAYNLGELIHEDVNRLELFLYLEGYKRGYLNNREANILESITIRYFSIPDLYNMKYLFHFNTEEKAILEYKLSIYDELQMEEKNDKYLYNIINNYALNVMKSKIISLNKYLDKQLTIDIDRKSPNIKEDETLLTLEELNEIYNEVVKIIFKNGQKLYQEAYWYGLNDRVLKRYR
ncbi:MAG: hypothetical protein AB2375_03975 [Tissierellaceae bacterium]